MKKQIIFALLVTHGAAVVVGFMAGIYALPIIIAPSSPDSSAVVSAAQSSAYSGEFSRDRKGSDAFHWGEGTVSLGDNMISLSGELAPGPDYKLYLSPEFVETVADFNRLKSSMIKVGDIKTFNSFIVPVSEGVDFSQYNTVVVWCESFEQFITSAAYVKKPQ